MVVNKNRYNVKFINFMSKVITSKVFISIVAASFNSHFNYLLHQATLLCMYCA
jgi:hypothetical protein